MELSQAQMSPFGFYEAFQSIILEKALLAFGNTWISYLSTDVLGYLKKSVGDDF